MMNNRNIKWAALEKLLLPLIISLLSVSFGHADNTGIYIATVDKPINAIYKKLYDNLEASRFFVVLEPPIGDNMARFKQRWGEDYNRNQLEDIRSLVVCNIWYVNQVANKDPDMLGLCPLRLSLVQKNGKTRILFVRPTAVAANSPARPVLAEVESIIIKAIEDSLTAGGAVTKP